MKNSNIKENSSTKRYKHAASKFITVLGITSMLVSSPGITDFSGTFLGKEIVKAADYGTVSATYTSGDCTVTYYSNGKLVVSGNGPMGNYTSYSKVPWYGKRGSVTEVIVEDGVTSLCKYFLYNFAKCTKVSLPDGITEIPEYAFYRTAILEDINIPEGVTTIGASAFWNDDGLIELILPSSLKTIGSKAFDGCNNLSKVSLPNSLETISERAFFGCAFTSVNIPSSVKNLGSSAYLSNSNLTDIVLNVTADSNIGTSVFTTNSSLNIVVQGESYDLNSDIFSTVVSEIKAKKLTVNINNGSIGETKTFSGAKISELEVKGDNMSVAEGAFKESTSLNDVSISGSASLKASAFEGCTGISSLSFGNGVSGIGASAFKNCTGLTSVTIPASASLGKSAFEGAGIKSLILTDGITDLGTYAFYNCKSLKEVEIPASVEELGTGTFAGCVALEEATVNHGVKSLGNDVFKGCTRLENATLPDSTITMGTGVFSGCTSITSGNIPTAIKEIPASTFSDCSNLVDVSFADDITSIGAKAFMGTSLTDIILPDTVTSVGNSAFKDCAYLKDVIFPTNASGKSVTLEALAFANTAITNIEFGSYTNFTADTFNGVTIDSLIAPAGMGDTGLVSASSSSSTLNGNYILINNDNFTLKDGVLDSNIGTIPKAYLICNVNNNVKIKSTTTVYCFANSSAHNWALNNNHPYVLIDQSDLDDLLGKASNTNGTNPAVTTATEDYQLGSGNAVSYGITLGTQNSAATGISCVEIGSYTVPTANYTYSNGFLVIDSAYLETLPAGNYTVSVTFNNGVEDSNSTLNVLAASVPDTSLSSTTILYNASTGADVTASIAEWGTATNITGIYFEGTEVPTSAYNISNNTVTFISDAFDGLNNGTYSVVVAFDNGIVDTTSWSVVVVGATNSNGSGSSDGSSSGSGSDGSYIQPGIMTTITYKFSKEHANDIVIPVNFGSADGLEKLVIGSGEVPTAYYKIEYSAIVIDATYLSTLVDGTLRILPTFNDVQKTTPGNLMLEITSNIQTSSLPEVLSTYVVYGNNDITMTYTLGTGSTAANSVTGIIIDGTTYDQQGNIVTGTTAQSTVSGSAISASFTDAGITASYEKTNMISSLMRKLFAFGTTDAGSSVSSANNVYEVNGDSIVVDKEWLASISLAPGIHVFGATFDDMANTNSENALVSVLYIVDNGTVSTDGTSNVTIPADVSSADNVKVEVNGVELSQDSYTVTAGANGTGGSVTIDSNVLAGLGDGSYSVTITDAITGITDTNLSIDSTGNSSAAGSDSTGSGSSNGTTGGSGSADGSTGNGSSAGSDSTGSGSSNGTTGGSGSADGSTGNGSSTGSDSNGSGSSNGTTGGSGSVDGSTGNGSSAGSDSTGSGSGNGTTNGSNSANGATGNGTGVDLSSTGNATLTDNTMILEKIVAQWKPISIETSTDNSSNIGSVLIDGAVVGESQYTVSGETVILNKTTSNNIEEGIHTITVTDKENNALSVTKVYVIRKAAKNVPIVTFREWLVKGTTVNPLTTEYPDEDGYKIVWTSGNESRASIDENGNITANKNGAVILYCNIFRDDELVLKVNLYTRVINKPKMTGGVFGKINTTEDLVVIMDKQFTVGHVTKIKTWNLDSDSTVKYTVEDPAIVTVSDKGYVKGLAVGNTSVKVDITKEGQTYTYYMNCCVTQ